MLQVAQYGNRRFTASLTVEYFTCDDLTRCRDAFVVRYTINEGITDPVEVVLDYSDLLSAIRQFGFIIKRYESALMYHTLTTGLLAQYKNADAELMDQHKKNKTPDERQLEILDTAMNLVGVPSC